MTAGTFLQQKLTPTGGDPQQQKMMMFMPVMMLFFFYKLAAGLTLYYTLQQLLSVLQQWWGMQQRTADAAGRGRQFRWKSEMNFGRMSAQLGINGRRSFTRRVGVPHVREGRTPKTQEHSYGN